jgi:hypothetical protein
VSPVHIVQVLVWQGLPSAAVTSVRASVWFGGWAASQQVAALKEGPHRASLSRPGRAGRGGAGLDFISTHAL